jgi:hypothetical protein
MSNQSEDSHERFHPRLSELGRTGQRNKHEIFQAEHRNDTVRQDQSFVFAVLSISTGWSFDLQVHYRCQTIGLCRHE